MEIFLKKRPTNNNALNMSNYIRKGKKSFRYKSGKPKKLLEKVFNYYFLFGLLSLLWLIARTGTRPSRAVYPCQQMAIANAGPWFSIFLIPLFPASTVSRLKKHTNLKRAFWGFAIVLMFVLAIFTFKIFTGGDRASQNVSSGKEKKMESSQGLFSNLFVVENTDGTDNGFERLISLMEEQGLNFYKRKAENTRNGPSGLIAKDDLIIIKVNPTSAIK